MITQTTPLSLKKKKRKNKKNKKKILTALK